MKNDDKNDDDSIKSRQDTQSWLYYYDYYHYRCRCRSITITTKFHIAPPTEWTGVLNNKSHAYE